MVQAKKFVLKEKFQGMPKDENFELVIEDIPEPKTGEILTQAEFISVDPYMRVNSKQTTGSVMLGSQVARVLESKDPTFKEGDRLVADVGWRSHSVFSPHILSKKSFVPLFKLPDFGGLPHSLALGVLGMTGVTAYYGLLDGLHPKEGETVVVTAAAGAVGSTVGQLAAAHKCRVVGFAGTDEKVSWLKEIGFDAAYNYKSQDIEKSLQEGLPKGIDCFFDNVGGELSNTIIKFINVGGRMTACGSISTYNLEAKDMPKTDETKQLLKKNKIKVNEFSVIKKKVKDWLTAIDKNLKSIQEGKLKYKETITDGFENTPKAFIGMLKGENIGKAVVKV